MAGWISVKDKLPEPDEEVIVSIYDDSGDTAFEYTTVGWLCPPENVWIVNNERCFSVTHWMSRPKPFKNQSYKQDYDQRWITIFEYREPEDYDEVEEWEVQYCKETGEYRVAKFGDGHWRGEITFKEYDPQKDCT